MPVTRERIFRRPFVRLAIVIAISAARVSAADRPLENAAAVLSLTGEQASHRIPISVTGVVTAAEPDWTGQFFVEDQTGGVFVENLHGPVPSVGDLVSISGVSHPGAFAPIISTPTWQKIGTAPLPPARPVSIENLEAGVHDGQRVEISGVVRSVRIEMSRLNVDLAVGGYRLQVRAPVSVAPNPESLIASRVRVRGTTATHYNAALRHLTSVAVYVPAADDFTVLEPEVADPFLQPPTPINGVAQYRPGSGPAKRVHVRGTVTLQRIGEDVFVQDGSGGIRIESAQVDTFAPGTAVDAAGFLEYENRQPLLRDAVLRTSSAAENPTVAARAVTAADVRIGLHHADLITLRGKISDRSTRPLSRPIANYSGVSTTWLLQGENLSFTAEHEDRVEDPALASIPIGSVVEVSGVCFSEIDQDGKLKSLTLLLPSASAMRILERPSWLTPGRLLIGLAIVSLVLLVVLLWSVTVSKKNAALRFMVHELKTAQERLQEAHDTLEQKVIERSAQLQTEMSARKTAELQFKAVLAERTRLARDLHDTLEQTLTGIALQLDTASKLFQRSPDGSNHHLQLARNWLRQSQVDLRRSIWDLRSRELEQFDLASALDQSARQLVEGTEIAVEFVTRGPKRSLPEVVEENVLRVGQEALTNIAKHARATRIRIALEFASASLLLAVEDDGIGFDHGHTPAPGDNHFGLLGMSERAKRLAGRLVIDSSPGRGARIKMEVPLEPIDDASNAAHSEKVTVI